MSIRRAYPPHWPLRLVRVALAMLWLLMTLSCMAMFLLDRRGHQLSGVRFSHIVGHDGSRYYQKPRGPFDLREPISREQAEVHERYRRYAGWAGMAGGGFLLAFLLIIFTRPNQEIP